jgi:hypothetical protein
MRAPSYFKRANAEENYEKRNMKSQKGLAMTREGRNMFTQIEPDPLQYE